MGWGVVGKGVAVSVSVVAVASVAVARAVALARPSLSHHAGHLLWPC